MKRKTLRKYSVFSLLSNRVVRRSHFQALDKHLFLFYVRTEKYDTLKIGEEKRNGRTDSDESGTKEAGADSGGGAATFSTAWFCGNQYGCHYGGGGRSLEGDALSVLSE